MVMEGVRVVEVSLYALVPTTGAVLSDWGADVIKVEHPEHGDPIRGLSAWGVPPGTGGITYLWEVFNRGKRSVGIDLAKPEGLEALMRLVETADVFLTNFLGPARRRLGIDVGDIRARNPRIIYVRGTGHGPDGPDADKGGFDGISYWARSGASTAAMPARGEYPVPLPGPAFGDIQAGMQLAGGVAAALYRRERTGEGAVVDGSLLASGLWAMQASMCGSYVSGASALPGLDRTRPENALANVYRTSDGRFVQLSMLEARRYWEGFCAAISRPDLAGDPRFADDAARAAHLAELVAILGAEFAKHPLAEWEAILASQEGQWAKIQVTAEALDDPQAAANGFVKYVTKGDVRYPLVTVPVQIDQAAPELSPAPELGADTEEILLEAGFDWDDLARLKEQAAIS
jgi:crotonobetainyl-CoA:carnitine CoA-transferase CaiB-like acyl-CoA transferase